MNNCLKRMENFVRKNHILFFVLYGIIIALAFIIPVFFVKESGGANWYKVKRLNEAFAIFDETGQFDYAHISHSEGWFYFPFFMKWFNLDAEQLFMAIQSLFGIVSLSIYPIMIYKLYKSIIVSLVSPFLFNCTIGDMLYRQGNEEFYTIMWAAVVALPFLVLLFNERRKKHILIYSIIIALSVALSNCLRFHSGLPVVVVLLLLMIYKIVKEKDNRGIILVSLASVLFLYNSFSAMLPEVMARKWDCIGKNEYNSSPWHSFLIGLGCYDNKYGLEYNDNCAMNLVKERWPEIEYLSDEYYYKCKDLFFELLKNDPKFVIMTELHKFVDCIREDIDYIIGNKLLFVLIILSIVALIFRRRKYITSHWLELSISLLFCLISTYGGIAAIPKVTMYTYSSVGCVSILVFFLTITVLFHCLGQDKSSGMEEDKHKQS